MIQQHLPQDGNMRMQYAAISKGCEKRSISDEIKYIFLIFATNIDRRFTLGGGSYEYPHSVF